ncbi:TPA: hypothetical protein ACP5TR_004763 [Vibrio parahaemolyticus]
MKNYLLNVFTLAVALISFPLLAQNNDPLPSWQDGQTKQAIIQFVVDVTDPKSPNFVAPQDRIATFDNDGTLWSEKPLPSQILFVLDQIKEQAASHPDWKEKWTLMVGHIS